MDRVRLKIFIHVIISSSSPSDIAFMIKGNASNGRNILSRPFLVIEFINEEVTGCINEEAIGAIDEAAIKAITVPRNPSSCFLISCFIVLVVPAINNLIFRVTLQL